MYGHHFPGSCPPTEHQIGQIADESSASKDIFPLKFNNNSANCWNIIKFTLKVESHVLNSIINLNFRNSIKKRPIALIVVSWIESNKFVFWKEEDENFFQKMATFESAHLHVSSFSSKITIHGPPRSGNLIIGRQNNKRTIHQRSTKRAPGRRCHWRDSFIQRRCAASLILSIYSATESILQWLM